MLGIIWVQLLYHRDLFPICIVLHIMIQLTNQLSSSGMVPGLYYREKSLLDDHVGMACKDSSVVIIPRGTNRTLCQLHFISTSTLFSRSSYEITSYISKSAFGAFATNAFGLDVLEIALSLARFPTCKMFFLYMSDGGFDVGSRMNLWHSCWDSLHVAMGNVSDWLWRGFATVISIIVFRGDYDASFPRLRRDTFCWSTRRTVACRAEGRRQVRGEVLASGTAPTSAMSVAPPLPTFST